MKDLVDKIIKLGLVRENSDTEIYRLDIHLRPILWVKIDKQIAVCSTITGYAGPTHYIDYVQKDEEPMSVMACIQRHLEKAREEAHIQYRIIQNDLIYARDMVDQLDSLYLESQE